jgi:diguanylate cyclase (GGDEF)-like protein/PAS domain S-box-containing protein
MTEALKTRESLRASGRSKALAVGWLLEAGAALVVLSLLLPHPSGGNTAVLIGTAAAMVAVGLLCVVFAARVPAAVTHAVLAAAVVATGVLVWASGVAAGQYGAIFVWAILIAGYYFPPRLVAAHLFWILGTYAVTLAVVQSTAGYSPFTRWLFTAISLSVVAVLTTTLVARRRQADLRARRFFDLSRDMLCTFDRNGNVIELNSAWEDSLGYSAAELRSGRPFEFLHPDERARSERGVATLFEGVEGIGFENRYRAKDGSWHWLSWSATLAPDESLIYARATDVTELKRVESERENLLTEVAALARSDALTGLPNRRVLDEQLPREMSRARRAESELCLAILDLDNFKAYNDAHGHLAGDGLLRDCAIAWDSELRGEDTIVRYGGEEFLVVLPECTYEQAAEIVERLRAAIPGEQTCSAGLACWDFTELAVDLVGRADSALYRAKAMGRDRLVQAPRIES